MTSTVPLTIDVVSDVVCPWCFLGKRRLSQALEKIGDMPVTVRWRPFRLDPTIPAEGIAREVYLTRKFGSVHGVDDMHQRLAELGAQEGIDYRFDRITRSPDTTDAHRVIAWAEADGIGEPVVEALFRGYFTEGRDIGDHAVLTEIAAEAGLDPTETKARLASEIDRAEIEAAIRDASDAGITGVPCFVLAGRYGVMGAQSAETLAQAITEIAAASAEQPAG